MKIDPEAPGYMACLRGEAGLWMLIMARGGTTVILCLFVLATYLLLL